MIEFLLFAVFISLLGALLNHNEISKLQAHIDHLYENDEILMREIEFQDEWIELDIDLDDIQE